MSRRQHQPSSSAFSLVEIAIVMAIIGLLVGGVLMGQALLNGQRLRTVLTDATTYATAINQFKIKYAALPGDMPNATEVWGSDASACTSALDATGGTCNGNGNSYIDAAGAINVTSEQFQLWRHLQLAGLIAPKLSGLNGPSGINFDTVPGVNSPKAILPNTTYWFYGYWGEQTDNGTFYTGDYTNAMVFGAQIATSWPSGVALTPREAFELDTKGDDGKPAFGAMRMFGKTWSGNKCVTSDTGSAAEYNVSSTALECRMLFMNTYMQSKEQQR